MLFDFFGKTGIPDSKFFLCPLPELLWPVYSLSNQDTQRHKIGIVGSCKYVGDGEESFSAFPVKTLASYTNMGYAHPNRFLNCHILTGKKNAAGSQEDDLYKVSVRPLNL